MPSKPTLISTGVTPAALQVSSSVSFMAREALVKSGVFSPTPPQNSFMPPPVPVELDDRGLELAALAELLGNGGGERKHGRRTDDLDLVARRGIADRRGERERAADAVRKTFFIWPTPVRKWSRRQLAPGRGLKLRMLQLDDSFVSRK